MRWHSYYYRTIGFALAGAGLILDELIHGPFTSTPANHKLWGLVLLVVGGVFTAKKAHGKD
jgi:hypothetical protein